MRTRALSVLFPVALTLSLVGCGSDDDKKDDSSSSSSSQSQGSGGSGSASGADKSGGSAGMDGEATLTIDGKPLEGDLDVACGSIQSMNGAPNSLFIANTPSGTVTSGGEKVSGSVTISIGYGPEAGGKLPLVDYTITVGDFMMFSMPTGSPEAQGQELSGESDGKTWTFTLKGMGLNDQTPHTVEGSASCTP